MLKANRKAIASKIERAARYLDIKDKFDGFLKWIVRLRRDIGIPNALKDIGINEKRLDEVAAMAVKDPSAASNPIPFTEAQYKTLARKCIKGTL